MQPERYLTLQDLAWAALRSFETPSDHRFEIRTSTALTTSDGLAYASTGIALTAVRLPTADSGETNRLQLFPGCAPGYE